MDQTISLTHFFAILLNFLILTENFVGMASTASATQAIPPDNRRIFEFVLELGIRLRAQSVTIASGSVFCHRVLRQPGFPAEHICPYTLASACMLVAGKVTNDPRINTRDVMNVAYSILHPDSTPLDIGELSYALREGLIEMELVVVRFLRFRLNFEHPHQDLVLMLRLLRDWYPAPSPGRQPPLDAVAAMLLQDLYARPQIVLDHKPRTLAVVILSMAIRALGLAMPEEEWAPVFMPRYDAAHLARIRRKIVDQVYEGGGGAEKMQRNQ